jgi:hypothetical protein
MYAPEMQVPMTWIPYADERQGAVASGSAYNSQSEGSRTPYFIFADVHCTHLHRPNYG